MTRYPHRRWILGLCVALGMACLAGERPGPDRDLAAYGRLAVKSFRTENSSLPSDAASSLIFDQRGFLWAGTQQGAAKFNGWRWEVLNLPRPHISNWVQSLVQTRDGSLWFGTSGDGLHRYAQGLWTSYTDGMKGFPRCVVQSLLEAPGPDGRAVLWVGTQEAGLWSIDAEGQARREGGLAALHPGGVLALHWDGKGLWAGTTTGLFHQEGAEWRAYTTRNSGLPHDTVRCVYENRNPRGEPVLWFGTQAGLARLEGGVWSAWTPATGLPCHSVVKVREATDADGQQALYLATDAGLLRWRDGRFTHYGESAGVPGLIEDLAVQGGAGEPLTLWVASYEGVVKVQPNRWVSFQNVPGLVNKLDVFRVLISEEPDGHPTLWLGTAGQGLVKLHKGVWTTLKDAGGHRMTSCYALIETRDSRGARTLWVGTREEGLFRYQGGRWTWYHRGQGLPDDRVYCLLETRGPGGESLVWAGTRGGLCRWDGRAWRIFTTKDGLPSDLVDCLTETEEPDGRRILWAGTRNGGILRMDGDRWTTIGEAQGLHAAVILSLQEQRDPSGRRRLWVGTAEAGLWSLELDTPELKLGHFDMRSRPALPTDTVYGVKEDAAGRLYLFTSKGVVRLSPRAPTPKDPSPYATYTFTLADGLPSNDTNQGSLLRDEKGRLWVGTPNGAAVFDPASDLPDTRANPLVLESATRMDRGLPFQAGTTISSKDSRIRFEWALLSFTKEEDSRFRTQLVGLESEPSPWGTATSAEYARLPAGSYTFRVWGRDHAENLSGPVDFPFTVRGSPWLSAWAIFAYVVTGIAAVWGLVGFRTALLARRNAELEAAVAAATARLAYSERHAQEASRAKSAFLANMSHELRTPLNGILLYSELLRGDAEERGEQTAMEDLGKIIGAGKHLLSLINGILDLSKIEAGKMEVASEPVEMAVVLQEVVDTLGPLAAQKGNRLATELAPDLPALTTDLTKLRQILLNLGGNAIKFTEGGVITFGARAVEGALWVEVRDTGIGMTAEQVERVFHAYEQASDRTAGKYGGTGLGLTITQRFVELLGGEISATSEVGVGTTFSFHLPLQSRDEG